MARILLTVMLLRSMASGQAEELNPSLHASWPGGHFMGVRYTMMPPEIPELAIFPPVMVTVVVLTVDREVRLDWGYRDQFSAHGGTGATGGDLDVETVPFQPTAVNRKLGATPVLFVAGYDPATGSTIVEEWRFALKVEVTGDREGETPTVTLDRRLTRRRLLDSPLVSPLHSIAYNACADRLWLFESEPPFLVSSMDVDVGSASLRPEIHADLEGYEFLQDIRHVHPVMVEPSAPDGGGFLFVCPPFPSWRMDEHLRTLDTAQHTVLRDRGCDGTFEEIRTGTYRSVLIARDYHLHEDRVYR